MTANNAISGRLGGQAAFFFAGNVFTLLVGLPLQIYVARTLGADGLGVFSLVEGGVGLVAGLLGFGLAPALVRFIPAHLERGEHGGVRRLVRKGGAILLAAGGAAYALLLLALPLAGAAWPPLAEHRDVLAVMGALVPLGLLAFFLQQGLRGFQDVRYMVIGSSFLQLTVKAALAVAFLAAGFHLIGYAWAVVISVACGALWMARGLRARLAALPQGCEAEPGQEAEWRRYAAVQYSGSLLGMGTQYLDRFLLGLFFGASPIGVLAVVKQLQQLPVVFLQMLLSVAAPMFAAAHARGDAGGRQHLYSLTTDWVVRLSAPMFIFFLVFAGPVLGLFGPEFAREGRPALWILLAAQAVNLGMGPLGNLLNMSGGEDFLLKLAVWEAVLSLAALAALAPLFGLTGAACAIALSIVFQNVAALVAARRRLGIRWADRRYLGWLLPGAACALAGQGILLFGPRDPGAAALALYLALLYAVFHGVSLLRGLHEDDRQLLGHIRARLGPGGRGAA